MSCVTDSCKHLKDKLRKVYKDVKVKLAQLFPTLCNPIPSPGDLSDPGIEPGSPTGGFFTIWAIREAHKDRRSMSNQHLSIFLIK